MRSERVSPDAMHSGNHVVLGVESKKRRVDAEEAVLEAEENIDPGAFGGFRGEIEESRSDEAECGMEFSF